MFYERLDFVPMAHRLFLLICTWKREKGHDIIPWRSSKWTFGEALIHSEARGSWSSFAANPSPLQSPNTIGTMLQHLTWPQQDTAIPESFLSHMLLLFLQLTWQIHIFPGSQGGFSVPHRTIGEHTAKPSSEKFSFLRYIFRTISK